MRSKRQLVLHLLLLAMLVNLAACARMKYHYSAHDSASPMPTSPPPTPKHIAPADLAQLRWIEGSWRGTGGGVPPFYERYKFENDSTLIVETLADETLSKVTDVSRFELKNGQFGSLTDDSGSVATALDQNSITFSRLEKRGTPSAGNANRITRGNGKGAGLPDGAMAG